MPTLLSMARLLPLLLLAAAPVHAQPAGAAAPLLQAADLAGLWKAKRRFGPDVQGPLVIVREGDGLVADIGGRVLPVRSDGDAVGFDMPGDEGAFRGRRAADGTIRGHWLRPPTPANRSRYATPLRLHADGPGRWRGSVATLQDELTFFLLVGAAAAHGTLPVVLRNPERDIGTQIGARRLAFDGSGVTLLGARGTQAERVLARGAYDPDNQTLTLDFPSRGGAFVFARDSDESDFYPRGRHAPPYAWRAPLQRDDGWHTGSLARAGIDRGAIERLVQSMLQTPMDSADAPQIHALLIARHGRLVLEEYFHGWSRDRLHDTRSAAKSLTAVTIGAAMHAGAPITLATPVYRLMEGDAPAPETDPAKRAMTLEHLLTMSSGYHCDDGDDAAPGNEETMTAQSAEPDYYRYTLAVPLVSAPGHNAVYCSASPNLALGMLGRATGEMAQDVFERLVGTPLRWGPSAWPLDPLGRPYGGGSVQLLPRDFLKLGQLMLDGGVWSGHRVLDARFVAAATAPQYRLNRIFYGYQWWVEDLPYKARTLRSYSARGAGGNVVTVVPALGLVVATMAGNYASRVQLTYTGNLVPRSILPAVRERGDDPAAPVQPREFTSPYGRSRVAGPR